MHKEEYLSTVKSIHAINPTHQPMKQRWAKAMRLVDYWVDQGYLAEDSEREKDHQKALRMEEKYFNSVLELEEELPIREIENAKKQLEKSE